MKRRKQSCLLVLLLVLLECSSLVQCQFGFEEEAEEYKGRFIAAFNSYHHQVRDT